MRDEQKEGELAELEGDFLLLLLPTPLQPAWLRMSLEDLGKGNE
jgi:hypothetical protein